jgi:hypothetical protein
MVLHRPSELAALTRTDTKRTDHFFPETDFFGGSL